VAPGGASTAVEQLLQGRQVLRRLVHDHGL
jgi:hypothetical protein